jgi:hypothetical protein
MVHVSLMWHWEWREFPSAPCLAGEKKLDESSRLDVVEIVCVAWHASFLSLQQKKTFNSAHEKTPLYDDTIDSVLRHREVGRAKDLSAPFRMVSYWQTALRQKFLVTPYCTYCSADGCSIWNKIQTPCYFKYPVAAILCIKTIAKQMLHL